MQHINIIIIYIYLLFIFFINNIYLMIIKNWRFIMLSNSIKKAAYALFVLFFFQSVSIADTTNFGAKLSYGSFDATGSET